MEKPPVTESKMEAVLLDLHLAESYSQGLGENVKSRFEKNYDTLPDFYLSVLKHHHLSFQDFNEALQWYKERPIKLDSLYQNIINRFNELKAAEGIKDIEETNATEVPQNPQLLKEQKDSVQIKDTLRHKKDTVTTLLNNRKQSQPVIDTTR